MKEIVIQRQEAGQRLDRVLQRYLKEAPSGFIYRMLRKKNITLNGKKAAGPEKLQEGDCLRLYFSDETLARFTGLETDGEGAVSRGQSAAMAAVFKEGIIYEDEQILLFNKPAGMLSQKAKPEDLSACEYLTAYLKDKGEVTDETLRTFVPAPCNRLDRNTSGLLACGKTTEALQALSAMFRLRTAGKYYQCIVAGKVKESGKLTGFLEKNRRQNQVRIDVRSDGKDVPVLTLYEPLKVLQGGKATLLQVELVTGKTHQIRAHLAWAGHPILGDPKYGDPKVNREISRSCPLKRQLLHAGRLTFPQMPGKLAYLSGRSYEAPLPDDFALVLETLCRRDWPPAIS